MGAFGRESRSRAEMKAILRNGLKAVASAAVAYRRDCHWIDDKDFASKWLFSFIMFLFTLTETEGKQGAPVITIPAG